MPILYPTTGTPNRIVLTGFATPQQLPGATCKSVIISARRVIAGLVGGASAGNSDVALIAVGSAPVTATAYSGFPLAAGETVEVNCTDASMIWVAGASGDVLTYNVVL